MWDHAQIEPARHVDYTLRTASCLGALGYSPHEVVCIVAEQLGVDHEVVAEVLKYRGAGSVAAA